MAVCLWAICPKDNNVRLEKLRSKSLMTCIGFTRTALSELGPDEEYIMAENLDLNIMSSWPRLQKFCYLLGYSTLMDSLSPQDRERVHELERDHFMKTDGAALKKLSPSKWNEWVRDGKPRPGSG
jgi:hypothetical protein